MALRRFFALCLAPALGALHAAIPLQEVPPPVIPARVFDVTKFGAVGDGKTMNTEAFAKAIAACGKAGGGSVVVPAGEFRTGPIKLISHLALVVSKGATIKSSDNFSDFGFPDPLPETQEELSALRKSMQSLISGADLTDVAIRGEGTIDGSGARWWAKSDRAARSSGQTFIPRPNLIVIRRCARLAVTGVTLSNSPQFHLVPQLCTDVLIEGVKILAPPDSPNTDAIDPSNCRNVIIRRVLTDTGDDNIAFKANGNGPMEDCLVTDCTFLHGHGVSVGSETNGGVRNILVQRSTFENTGTAIRIKSARGRGGVVENVTYRDITMKNVDAAIYINLFYDDKTLARNPKAAPMTAETPVVRNILISNVVCENAKSAGEIVALPESPATNIVLENIRITSGTGFLLQDAKGLQLKDVSVTTSPKAAIPPTPKDVQAPAPRRNASAQARNATVAADGSGNFRSVQEAIDAAPKLAPGQRPFMIHIKPGTYKEVVSIPRGKGPIELEGEAAAITTITYSNAASTPDAEGKPLGTSKSATMMFRSDDFTAENITFENRFGAGSQALAISLGGDRAVFRNCRFLGWQDTIFTREGRQYFADCAISGAADFIFGAGTVWFEHCVIHCIGGGFITAASTPETQPFGFVFSHCQILSEPGVKTFLGRPWRPFASVLFMETEMPEEILPEGWSNWGKAENEKTARFAEYKSTGAGARFDGRVPWARQLNEEQARTITLEAVLRGWNPANSRY